MPSLKQLTCNVQWSGSEMPLPEYQTRYGDGRAETYIAVPEFPTPFAIRLRSSGWIAFGLAMFVYIDGEYQCNRNRRNLKIPDGTFPDEQAEVDIIVRQKEVYSHNGSFWGSPWKFEKLNLVNNTPEQLVNPAPFEGEYIGTIEVVVLRCHPSVKNTLLDAAVDNSAQAVAETYTSVTEQMNSQELPSDDRVGGFSGLLDGANDCQGPGNRGLSHGGDGSWDEQVWVPDENLHEAPEESQEWHSVRTGPRTGIYQPKSWPSPVQRQQVTYGSTGSNGGNWIQPQEQPHGTPRSQLTPAIPGTPTVVINVAHGTPQTAAWAGNLASRAPSVADSWASRKTVYEAGETKNGAAQYQNDTGSGWPGPAAQSHRRDESSRTFSVRPAQSPLGPSNQGPRNSPRGGALHSTGITTGGDGWGNNDNQTQGGGWSNDANENRSRSWKNVNNPSQGSCSWDNKNNQNQGVRKSGNNTNQDERDSNWNNSNDQDQAFSSWNENNTQIQGGRSWDTSNKSQNHGGANWENNGSPNEGANSLNNGSGQNRGSNNGNGQKHDNRRGNSSHQNQEFNQNGERQTAQQQHDSIFKPNNVPNQLNTSEQSGISHTWKQPVDSDHSKVNNQTQGLSTPSGGRATEHERPPSWFANSQQGLGTHMNLPSNSQFGGSKPNSPHLSNPRGKLTYARPPAPITTSPALAQRVSSSPSLPQQISQIQPFVVPRTPTSLSQPTAAMPSRFGHECTPTSYTRPYWRGLQQATARQDKPVPPKSIIQRSEPGGPLYTVSEEMARRKKVSHQVQTGKPMAYTHKRMTPKYMDSHENPYAVFVFKYRSEALLEERFNITVAESEEDQKKRLQDLPKEELIEHMFNKIKTSSAKSSSPAPVAWAASPQPSVSGFGPSGLPNGDQEATGIGIDMGQVSNKLNQLQVNSNYGHDQNSPNPENLWGRDTKQGAQGQSDPVNNGAAWKGDGGNGALGNPNGQDGNATGANSNWGGASQNGNGAANGGSVGTGRGGDTGQNSGWNGNNRLGSNPNGGGGAEASHWNNTNGSQGNCGNGWKENAAGNPDDQQW